MPKNKLAAYRYRLIDSFLENGKKISLTELQEKIADKLYQEFDIETGLSQRQLLYDIALMRKDEPEGFGAPIIRKNNSVYYADKNYCLSKLNLNHVEKNILVEAILLLKTLQLSKQSNEINLLLSKLKMVDEPKNVVQFDTNTQLVGLEFLPILKEHIYNRQFLKIQYQPISEPVQVIEVHCHLLKEYNNRWFAICINTNKQVINLALDRIINIECSNNIENWTELDTDYFSHSIGASVPYNREIEAIKIKIDNSKAHYFLSKPLHKSQIVIEQTSKHTTIEVKLIANIELEAELLRFCDYIKITEPLWLQERIKKRLNQAQSKYQ